MKIAYIAHPIGGDPDGNVKKILAIIKQINLEEPDVVPFAPYLGDVLALDDNNPDERERGIKNDKFLLSKGFIDEVRLYGDRISKGMADEIGYAAVFGIPVIPMSQQLYDELMVISSSKPVVPFMRPLNRMLTAEDLRKMPDDQIFAAGITTNDRNGIYVTNDHFGEKLGWVAKRGTGDGDWAIYYHWAHHSVGTICRQGDKVRDPQNIKNLVPCDEDALELYRR